MATTEVMEVAGVMLVHVMVGIVLKDSNAGCEVIEVVALLRFDHEVALVLQFDWPLTDGGWVEYPFFGMISLDTSLTQGFAQFSVA